MSKLDNAVYNLKEKMINSKIGLKIKDTILMSPVCDILYKGMHFFNLTTASRADKTFADIIQNNVSYFDKNANRVQNIIAHLEDDTSKEVFKKMIKYRCSFLKKDHPKFHLYDQYFPSDIVKLTDKEVFIDCGAYTGDTILKFIKYAKNKYKKIVAFEPDEENIEKLKSKNIEKCDFIQAAVYNKEGITKFCHDNVLASSSKLEMTENMPAYLDKNFSEYEVNLKVLDNIPDCQDATFIKMDIEGAELNALKGAQNIIRKNHPKLAICIYHSNDDMLNISEWIISLKLDYKLYVRSHFGDHTETVLYAV